MRITQPNPLSETDDLLGEAIATQRHEFMAGQVLAVAGDNLRHNRIALNLATSLLSDRKGNPYQIFMSDVRLHVARENAYYYPDVMVTCSETAVAGNETNPVSDPALVVVELPSPSTETINRRERLAAYHRLPRLGEYALISQEARHVGIYRRQGDIDGLYRTHESGDTVEFSSVSVSLPQATLNDGTGVGG